MKRVTPEQVIDAYRRTGWEPVQDEWFDKIDGKVCGCALTAMIGSENRLREIMSMPGELEELIAAELGLSEDYVIGFVQGFDERAFFGGGDVARIGWQDGKAAWEAVRQELLNDEL